jgi:anti-anti-sigma factor
MEIDTVRESGALIAKAEGRVDGANAQEFQEALEAAIGEMDRVVILELEQLSYISSAGLRAILSTARALQQKDTKFAICSLSDSIREVFQVSGFDQIITVSASREEAMSALMG